VQGFFIDIGVIVPEQPGHYLCGIECDGATYHSHPIARDRDRIRQEILENRGWDIFRIWSTDWYRNRKLEVERLRAYLRQRSSVNVSD
jgi:very-short-patch-repair endonuclease